MQSILRILAVLALLFACIGISWVEGTRAFEALEAKPTSTPVPTFVPITDRVQKVQNELDNVKAEFEEMTASSTNREDSRAKTFSPIIALIGALFLSYRRFKDESEIRELKKLVSAGNPDALEAHQEMMREEKQNSGESKIPAFILFPGWLLLLWPVFYLAFYLLL